VPYPALFTGYVCVFTDLKGGYVFGKCGANIKEDRTQTVCVYRGPKSQNSYLKLKGRNIPFVNHIKYLDVIFDKLTTLRIQRKTIDAKACKYKRLYSKV